MVNFNNSSNSSKLSKTPADPECGEYFFVDPSDVWFTGGTAVSFVGIIFSMISFVAMVAVKNLSTTYREIFISLTVANFFGSAGMFSLYVANHVSSVEHQSFDCLRLWTDSLQCFTVLLSVTHILCLAQADYAIISSQYKSTVSRSLALIVYCWVFSISFSAVWKTQNYHPVLRRLIMFAFILASSGFVTVFYIRTMTKLHERVVRIQSIRDTFLRNDNKRYLKDHHRRVHKCPRIIMLGYFLCSFPMAIVDALDAKAHEEMQKYVVPIYSINYVFVASVFIFVKLMEPNQEERITNMNGVVISQFGRLDLRRAPYFHTKRLHKQIIQSNTKTAIISNGQLASSLSTRSIHIQNKRVS